MFWSGGYTHTLTHTHKHTHTCIHVTCKHAHTHPLAPPTPTPGNWNQTREFVYSKSHATLPLGKQDKLAEGEVGWSEYGLFPRDEMSSWTGTEQIQRVQIYESDWVSWQDSELLWPSGQAAVVSNWSGRFPVSSIPASAQLSLHKLWFYGHCLVTLHCNNEWNIKMAVHLDAAKIIQWWWQCMQR